MTILSYFKPVDRPEPLEPDSTLDEELLNRADEANLTLYFVNLVVVKANGLPNMDTAIIDLSDPFCEVTVGQLSEKTFVVNDTLDPVWNYKMSFFVPQKPEKMTLTVWDHDSSSRHDECGHVEFEFGSFFEINGSYEGDLELTLRDGVTKQGTITINVKCRTLKPMETEIKLGYVEQQLEWKQKEQVQTIAALDESEELRKQVIDELSTKEQEIVKKAEEIANNQKLHLEELSTKDQELMDRAQQIEEKIKEKEQIEVARREAELKKLEAETKLTEAEKEMLKQAEIFAEKDKLNSVALTEKEQEIVDMGMKLKEKEKANENFQNQLQRTEALREEIDNELTAKERMIQDQAKQLEEKAKEHAEALTAKEKQILETSKALEERQKAADEAQKKQDESIAELQSVKQKYDALQQKADTLEKEKQELEKQKQELEKRADQAADCSCILM